MKRSIEISGRRTSVYLSDADWAVIQDAAKRLRMPTYQFLTRLTEAKPHLRVAAVIKNYIEERRST